MSPSRLSAYRSASSTPFLTSTRNKIGIGTASMISRKINPNRIFPVRSAMRPTTAGPRNEADLSVSENREKKDDSCPCRQAHAGFSRVTYTWDEF